MVGIASAFRKCVARYVRQRRERQTMEPIEILKNEHRIIEQVLSCLDRISANCVAARKLDAQAARDALDFFRSFADGCHHRKEEDYLFPALEARGLPAQAGPTAVMRSEHVEGRRHIQAMDGAIVAAARGDNSALDTFARHAQAYVRLLREHIAKEDNCLFPMANASLSPTDQQTLLEAFHGAERAENNTEKHERFIHLADKLAERFGVAATAASFGCGC